MLPRQPAYFNAPNAGYLVPAAGVHRSASVSHQRPAQIIINNDNAAAWDDHGGHRPRSAHGGLYYDEHDHVIYERGRSGSRVRMRAPSPQPEFDSDTKEKLKDYTEMKKKQEEKEQQLRIEEKLRMDRLKKEADRIEKEKEEKKLKEKAIEEYKIKEEEERLKKKKQREEEDKEFEERMRKTLWANGYSRDQIERIIKKAEKQDLGGGGSSSRALTLNRPTYIKVHRKHLDPETLDVYHLPWEWDDRDSSYIIIKQWVPEADQDILFEHTRKIRETRQLVYATTELKKEKEQLLLVRKREPRKKSPVKTSWFMT